MVFHDVEVNDGDVGCPDLLFQESIMDGLGRTDVRSIDDGLRGLSSSAEVAMGLLSFSDNEDDEDDDDEGSTDSGTYNVGVAR